MQPLLHRVKGGVAADVAQGGKCRIGRQSRHARGTRRQHENVLRQIRRLPHVVRHHHDAATVSRPEALQKVLHAFPKDGVQGRKGFVHEENVRLHDERPPQGKALALAARELVRKAVFKPCELHFDHHRINPRSDLRFMRELQRQRHRLPHPHPGHERQRLPEHRLSRRGAAVALPRDVP